MATATFHPARLHGFASVPPAKSEGHRALLLAALGQGTCRLHGFTPPLCDDLQAMINGIRALGAKVTLHENMALVEPAPATIDAPPTSFHVNACAAALRMLIPVFWARGQAVRITMDDALFARPLSALEPLAERIGDGMKLFPPKDGSPAAVELCGKMNAGAYEVSGALSSQFASGLLIALSHATDEQGHLQPSTLHVLPPIVSRPYLDMTLAQMIQFGVSFDEVEEGVFSITPSARQNPNDVAVSGDWSQAAVLLCANAMGSGTMVNGLCHAKTAGGSLQGDSKILEVLKQIGFSVCETDRALYVSNPSHAVQMPLHLDCTDIPDIAPILALTCARAKGTSVLRGVKRLKVKECDRLSTTHELLAKLGVESSISSDMDTLTVIGLGSAGDAPLFRGGFTADAKGDHRIVMLLAAAALASDAPITVTGVEALDKSWPDFLKTYSALGGVIS